MADEYESIKRGLFAAQDDQRLGDMLIERGFVTAEQLDECLREQQQLLSLGRDMKLGQIMLARGILSTARFLEVLSIRDAGADPQPDLPRVGRYVLRREVARGGMGTVYEAEDGKLRRRVALKLLREADGNEQAAARLRREAEIAAQLQHPNIVGIHEVGTERDSLGRPVHFIAMDFVDGCTLADLVHERRTPRAEMLRMLEDVARAVEFAHSKGVIHRDLKPANVLVDRGGRVVLTDFGLARAETGGAKLTATHAVLGTPHYMAPEQVAGRTSQIDGRTDVYALGVMLYEILVGQPPFIAATPAVVYQQVLRDEPRRPSSVHGRKVEKNLDVICLKAIEKERGRRYARAADFADDLARFRRGEPIEARPPSVLHRLWRGLVRQRAVVAIAALAIGGSATVAALVHDRQKRISEAEEHGRLQARLAPLQNAIRELRPMFYVRDVDLRAKLDRLESEMEILARDPTVARFAETWALLGTGWYFAGDATRAEEALLKAEQLAPADATVGFYLARLCLERSMIAGLKAGPSGATRPADAVRWSEKAHAYLSRPARGWAGAEEIDRHVAEAYRAMAANDATRVLLLCEEGLAKFGAALGSEEYWNLRGWVTTGEARLEAYRRAVERRPHYAWGSFMLGMASAQQGRTQAAIDAYAAAIRLNPRFAQAFVNRGTLLQGLGQLDAAISDFDAAIALAPGNGLAWSNRGVVRAAKGNLVGALADHDKAVELEPQMAEVYVNRSVARLKAGQADGALSDADAALRLNPDDAPGHVNRGNALEARGEMAAAIAAFDRAIAIDPKMAAAYCERGTARLRIKDRAGARADYDAAIAADRDHVLAYNNRATMRLEDRDLEGGLADLSQVLRLRPDDLEALFTRGSVRGHRGDLAGAIADWERVLVIAPADWKHRALTERQLAEAKRRR